MSTISSISILMSGSSANTWEEGRIVYKNGSTFEYAPNSGSMPAGILLGQATGGTYGTIINQGNSILCDSSGSISFGDFVGASGGADGKVVTVTADYAVGIAQGSATGNKVRILVQPAKLS